MTIHKAILDPSELLVFSVMTTGATKALFLSERQAHTLKLLAPLTRQARDLYNRSLTAVSDRPSQFLPGS